MGKVESLSMENWLLIEEKDLINLARDVLSHGACAYMEKEEFDRNLLDISRAFRLAVEGHTGETRDSGEPYIMHPITVARILLTEFHYTNVRQVIGALLHDVKESKMITLERITEDFDSGIAKNVDSVSKKDLHEYVGLHESPIYHTQVMMDQALHTWMKLLNPFSEVKIVSFANEYFGSRLRQRRDDDTFGNLNKLDDDEFSIKLADRIHNLRTLGNCTPEKRKKIFNETKKYFIDITRERFPDDIYILLKNEMHKLEREFVSTEVESILERTK